MDVDYGGPASVHRRFLYFLALKPIIMPSYYPPDIFRGTEAWKGLCE